MKALVIGGARSGSGVANLLNQKGYSVTLVSRDAFEGMENLVSQGIDVILDDRETDAYDNYDLIVKNPGIPNSHPLVKRFKQVINEIEVATTYNPSGAYYAISGTNGKTTTTQLLYEMLMRKDTEALLAGNIGISLSQKVFEEGDKKRDVALEIAAFQIEGLDSFRPKAFALLNLTPDHLDRYETEEAYYQAKLKLAPFADVFVRNIDDKNIKNLTKDFQGKVVDISMTDDAADVFVKDNQVYFGDVCLFDTSILKVSGAHNLLNAMFASTLAYLAGVHVKDIQAVLSDFSGIEHRLEFVSKVNDVLFYNDSKATNPESVEKALQSFKQPIILLAGGYDENVSFDLLKQYESKLKRVYLFGQSKYKLKEVFDKGILVEDMKEAFSLAIKEIEAGDVVLLSPACASYDQFKNFEERGQIFKTLVNDYQKLQS